MITSYTLFLTLLISLIAVCIILITRYYYTTWLIPRKTEWYFFKEYKSYQKNFYKYLRYVSRRHIEPKLFPTIIGNNKIIHGGFIVLHSKTHTYIKHMVFLNIFGSESAHFTQFSQIMGIVEDSIYLKNSDTVIHIEVPIENIETIRTLISLGYRHTRTWKHTQKAELVKSKIMNYE
jgi:hypothetical protein